MLRLTIAAAESIGFVVFVTLAAAGALYLTGFAP
jgi:hypothetical protein